MKTKLPLFLMILFSIQTSLAHAKCSDYVDLAMDEADKLGFGLSAKIQDISDRADDEEKPILKAEAIALAFITMPYLFIEGSLIDHKTGKILDSSNILDSAEGKMSAHAWFEFTKGIVGGVFSMHDAHAWQESIIAKTVIELNESESLCKVKKKPDGTVKARLFGPARMKSIVKDALEEKGIDIDHCPDTTHELHCKSYESMFPVAASQAPKS